METWGTIDPKQDGLRVIALIRDVTHRCEEISQAMLDIFQADKELMLCYQKDQISLTQYLDELKTRTEVVTGVGGIPGNHPAAVKLVNS